MKLELPKSIKYNKKMVNTGMPFILLLLSFVLVFVLGLSNLNKVRSFRGESAAQKQVLQDLELKISQLKGLTDKKSILDEDLALVAQAVPSDKEVPTLMTQIQQIALETGVRLTALQFSGTVTGEEKKKKTFFNDVNLRAAAEGDFLSLDKFLKLLENASRIIDVETLRFSKKSEEGTFLLSIEAGVAAYFTDEPEFSADEALDVDLTSKAFTQVLDNLKGFKIYNIVIPEEGVGKENPFE